MSESFPADVKRRIRTAARAFRRWRRTRPFWGGLLIVLSGLEIAGSTQLSLGNLQFRFGLEGLQAIVIPVILVLAGILIWSMPVHRIFYGVIALVVALYSLIGVNLGGFFIGMLLGILGGSLAVAWSPREPEGGPPSPGDGPSADDEPTSELSGGPWDDLQQPQDTRGARNDAIVPGMRDDRGASSVRLAVAGAVAGGLIVAALAPASAAGPILASGTTEDGCESDPAPTESPSQTPTTDPTTTPEPTRTPDSTETSGSTETSDSDPGLIESGVTSVTQLLSSGEETEDEQGDCEPTDKPTQAPTSEPTSEPTDITTTEPTGEPTPGADEQAGGTTDDEQSDETNEYGLPEGFELPDGAQLTTQQTLEGENVPFVAASPARLTGSSITMHSLVYEGKVDLPTADGPLTVMKLTMDKSVVADFGLAVDAMGETLLTTTDKLTIRGDVTFYTDRFVGERSGSKWTFVPETPPPFTLPLMVFTDPEIRLVAVEADVLTAEPMSQRRVR